jgi:hypothetical protein
MIFIEGADGRACRLELRPRQPNHQPVEAGCDFNLTRQAAVALSFEQSFEQGLLISLNRWNGGAPPMIDKAMAGPAATAAATVCDDSGNEILDGGLHHGAAHHGLDDMLGTVMLDKHDLWH